MKRWSYIVALTTVLTLIGSVTVVFAQGQVLKSPDELAHVGSLVGKTACVVITRDSRATGSTFEVCSKIQEVKRWSVKEFAEGHLSIKVEMDYQVLPQSKITNIVYFSGIKSSPGEWMAMVDFNEGGHIFTRGVKIDELRLF